MGGGGVIATEPWSEVGWVGVFSFRGKSLSVIGSPLIVLEAEGGDFFLVFFVFFGCRALVDHGRNWAGMGKNGNHHVMRR